MTDDSSTPWFFHIANHTDTSTPDSCWTWTGATDDRGRPRIRIAGRTEHVRTVTRCSCTNPRCINPYPHEEPT